MNRNLVSFANYLTRCSSGNAGNVLLKNTFTVRQTDTFTLPICMNTRRQKEQSTHTLSLLSDIMPPVFEVYSCRLLLE